MTQRILPFYFFSLECFYLYFILFIFYINQEILPPVLPFIFVFIVGQLILSISLKKRVISAAFPFIGVLIGGVAGYFLGLSELSATICIAFLYFRIAAFIKDSALWTHTRTQFALLFYTTGLILFTAGGMTKYPYIHFLYGIVVVFTIVFIIGSYLQQVRNGTHGKNVFSLIALLSIGTVLTLIVSLFVPVFKWIFFSIFDGLIKLVVLLAKPLFDLIENTYIAPPVTEIPNEQQIEYGEQTEEYLQQSLLEGVSSWMWLLLVLMILIGIVLFLWKKRIRDEGLKTDSLIVKVEYASLPTVARKRGKFFRTELPNENIRKWLYQFQLFAQKNGYGRYEYETVNEWFVRIELPSNHALVKAYESVRYGNGALSKNEEATLYDFLQSMKKELKERSKKQKMDFD